MAGVNLLDPNYVPGGAQQPAPPVNLLDPNYAPPSAPAVAQPAAPRGPLTPTGDLRAGAQVTHSGRLSIGYGNDRSNPNPQELLPGQPAPNNEVWFEAAYGRPPTDAGEADDARFFNDPQGRQAYLDWFHNTSPSERNWSMGAVPTGYDPHPGETIENYDPLTGALDSPPERALEIGLQGTGHGLADVAGGLVDLATAGMNLAGNTVNRVAGTSIPSIQNPVGGSQWWSNLFTPLAKDAGLTVRDQREFSPQENLNYNIDRFGTGAMVGSGLASTAAHIAEVAAPLVAPLNTGIGPRLFEALTAGSRENPLRAFVGDTAAGVGAGAGDTAYHEYAPESVQNGPLGPIAETLATLGGGVGGAGALSAGRGVGGLATRRANTFLRGSAATNVPPNAATGDLFRRTDVTEAARTVQNRAVNPMEAAFQIEENAAPLIPIAGAGQMPTAGMLSNDPGLIGLENQMRVQNPTPFIVRDNATREAAAGQIDQVAPANANGRDFTDPMQTQRADQVATAQNDVTNAEIAAQQADLQGRDAALNAQAAPGQGETAALGIDRNVVDQTLTPMQQANAQRFGTIDPDHTAMIDITGVQDIANQIVENAGQIVDPNRVVPHGLINRINGQGDLVLDEAEQPVLGDDGVPLTEDGPAQVSVGDIVEAWPEISQGIDRARKQGNYALADNLRQLRDGLNRAIDAAAAEGNEAAINAVAARTEWQRTLGTNFGQPGTVARDFRSDFNLDRGGRGFTPPSGTAGRFLQRGQPERARELKQIIDASTDRAAGDEAVHQYLMADLARSGVIDTRTGQLRPDVLRRWEQQWGQALSISPETQQAVDALLQQADNGQALRSGLVDDVRAARRTLGDVEANRGAFQFTTGKNPVNAVESIFSSGDPQRAVDQILAQIGTNQSARDGLKAAVREYLMERTTTSAVQNTTSGRNPVSFAALDKLFKQNEDALSAIFSPEEMNSLRAAHDFLRPLQNRAQQATTGSATAERTAGKDLWRFLEIGLKARYGILKGGGIMRTIRLWAASLPSNEAAVSQLIGQMWFDPELATTLLRTPVAQVGGRSWNRNLNRLLALDAGAREEDTTEVPQ